MGGITARIFRMFYALSAEGQQRSHWVCSDPMLDWLARQFGFNAKQRSGGAFRDPRFPPSLLGRPVRVRNDPGGLRLEQEKGRVSR